ncbi:MAG: hypothetical protein EXS31_03005 [Pedosphaera sp.]|nr:hypothetical protein [Pedosphaera sp.]
MKRLIGFSTAVLVALGTSLAQAATITVTTISNTSPAAGQTSLAQALAAVKDGDKIAFKIPGDGPHYIITPPEGYPLITANNVKIDGYSQPGSLPNTNLILASNNARLRIYLDSRDGGRTVMNLDGYGPTESAVLGFVGAQNATVRGLGFLAKITDGSEDSPAIYCVAFGGKAKGGHVNGCWLGVDADGKKVAGANAGVTGFRFREDGEAYLADDTVVGIKADALNPEAELNVIAGMKIPVIIEGANLRIAGNFFGVLPSGTNEFNNAVAGLPNEGAIQIGRSEGGVVIGTDGDGWNDDMERNVFSGVLPRTVDPVNGYTHLIEFYSGGQRTNIVIAGNYIGVGVDGTTRFTNGVPIVSGLTATARVGSDFDGVGDFEEGNVIYNNYPSSLFKGATLVRNFLENVSESAVISVRGNTLVNNFAPPVSPLIEEGAFLTNYYTKAMLEPELGVIPILSTNTTIDRLVGWIPRPETNSSPLTVIDFYIADPEGIALGKAEGLSHLPDGFVQGRTYIGSYFEGSAGDLDPEPGQFSFNISAFNIRLGTLLTITANYSPEQVGTHDAPTLTTLFSNPVVAREARSEPVGKLSITSDVSGVLISFSGVLESALNVAGPWAAVPGATSPYKSPADQVARFYRARGR